MLFFPLLSVVVPRVGGLLPQPTFSLSNVADDGVVVGAAPAAGYGAGASQGQLLAAIAFEDDVTGMPLVGLAERNLAAFVVCFGTLGYPCHSCSFPPTESAGEDQPGASARSSARSRASSSCHWSAFSWPCGPSRSSPSCCPASVSSTAFSASSNGSPVRSARALACRERTSPTMSATFCFLCTTFPMPAALPHLQSISLLRPAPPRCTGYSSRAPVL